MYIPCMAFLYIKINFEDIIYKKKKKEVIG